MNKHSFAVLALSSMLLLLESGDKVIAEDVVETFTRTGISLLGIKTSSDSLTRSHVKRIKKRDAVLYVGLQEQGIDEVSNTHEAAAMRNYRLRSKKRKGLWRTKEASLASIIFPGVSPKEYQESEDIVMYANLVESRRAQIPVEFYDLPVCQPPFLKSNRGFHTLSALLQGHDDNPQAPFPLKVKQDKGCTPLCLVSLSPEKVRWMREPVELQYRVHFTLDQLPVLMRSKELNYAIRGYPVGFKAPPSYTGLKNDEFYLYNHLRFTITYREDPSTFEGVRIIGFDVNPVSIHHDVQTDELTSSTKISTCNGEDAPDVVNNPSTYMPLRTSFYGGDFKVLYSYEVQWVASDLPWADRWDVYVLVWPDDDTHYFQLVSLSRVCLSSPVPSQSL
ncbi:Nonaspanin (TM9SF) [Fragilaria crotonensis]|nr:Nonaspanin (TM9SF) [Fragilaria crotonensis]